MSSLALSSNTSHALFQVMSCSYEGSLFGWNVTEDKDDAHFDVTMSFGFNVCQSSLRVITTSKSGKYLACGGTDERIYVYNVFEKKAVGELSNHSGAITSLKFFEDSHLFSGSEDNTICIWRVHDWLCVHILGGHKLAIHDIDIHPSGKLALSISKDNTMKLWNLVQGRCSFTRRLKGAADKIVMNETGSHYLLVINSIIQVYHASNNNVCVTSITLPCRVNHATFTQLTHSHSTAIINSHNNTNKKSNNNNNSSSSSNNNDDDEEEVDTHQDGMAPDMHVVCVGDNRVLYIYTLQGIQVSHVDLTSLGGRIKDFKILPPLSPSLIQHCIQNQELRHICESTGSLLSLVTSTGTMAVLSIDAVAQQHKGEQMTVAECTLAIHQIKIQPRLVAVAVTSCDYSKGKKNQKSPSSSSSSIDNKKRSRNSDDDYDSDDEVVDGSGMLSELHNDDDYDDKNESTKNKKNKVNINNNSNNNTATSATTANAATAIVSGNHNKAKKNKMKKKAAAAVAAAASGGSK